MISVTGAGLTDPAPDTIALWAKSFKPIDLSQFEFTVGGKSEFHEGG